MHSMKNKMIVLLLRMVSPFMNIFWKWKILIRISCLGCDLLTFAINNHLYSPVLGCQNKS